MLFRSVPSQSYWPIGALALAAKVNVAIAMFDTLGITTRDPEGNRVIRVPGFARFLNAIIPGEGIKIPDIASGQLGGLNLVTTGGGVPGLSTAANFALGAAVKKWGGVFKGLSDIFQPYGPEATIIPQPITAAYEVFTGEAPPWEPLSNAYTKAQWDRAKDAGIQYAYAELSGEGVMAPRQEDFGTWNVEQKRFILSPEQEQAYQDASADYLHQLFELGDN